MHVYVCLNTRVYVYISVCVCFYIAPWLVQTYLTTSGKFELIELDCKWYYLVIGQYSLLPERLNVFACSNAYCLKFNLASPQTILQYLMHISIIRYFSQSQNMNTYIRYLNHLRACTQIMILKLVLK